MKPMTFKFRQIYAHKMKYGRPVCKPLHQYFYFLDLSRFGWDPRINSPLDIANFVSHHTTYTSDQIVYGMEEHWACVQFETEKAKLNEMLSQ